MTRRDYQLIADAVRAQMTDYERPNWNAALSGFARDYAARAVVDNPRFDAVKFYAACGLYPDGYHWENANTTLARLNEREV